MRIIIFLLSVYIFLKTFYYGVFEIKENENKIGGFVVISFAAICLIAPNVMVYLR